MKNWFKTFPYSSTFFLYKHQYRSWSYSPNYLNHHERRYIKITFWCVYKLHQTRLSCNLPSSMHQQSHQSQKWREKVSACSENKCYTCGITHPFPVVAIWLAVFNQFNINLIYFSAARRLVERYGGENGDESSLPLRFSVADMLTGSLICVVTLIADASIDERHCTITLN